MIEQLLEAERMLSFGLVDNAERLYRQVATHDPKSSIAVVGLARVALERGDDRTAYIEASRALAIDPDNPAAQHMVMRLTEVMAGRGEAPPDVDDEPAAAVAAVAEQESLTPGPDPVSTAAPDPGSNAEPPSAPPPAAAQPKPGPAARPTAASRRGIVARLLGRRR